MIGMRIHRVLSVGLAMLLLSGFFTGLAIAENDSLHVIMTVEDKHYVVGDTVTIEVRVYDKGVLADASNITLGVSQHHNFNNPISLNLTNDVTGIYTGIYTITANDNHHNLYFFHETWLGSDHEVVDHHDYAVEIDVYSVQDTVDISFDGQKIVNARPGDVVTATILVRTGDTPIPITGFDHLYIEDQDGTQQNLSYRAETTGIYLTDFIVPEIVHSQVYEIYADPIDIGNHDSAVINVNVLDVWYHKLISGTTTSFEICVADLEGQPVENASFVIVSNNWQHDTYTGTTNASGMAIVHATDIYGYVGFSGYVLADGLNQTIMGSVINQVADDPHHDEFDIIWEGSQTMFKVGDGITIPYGAYDATAPAGSRTIYYYVEALGTDFILSSGNYGDHVEGTREVVDSGSIVTSPTGKFNLEFTAPDDQCALEVRFEVPLNHEDFLNEDYDRDDSMFYEVWPEHQWNTQGFIFYAYEGDLDGSSDVGISGGRFNPGEAGTITVNMDTQNGDRIMAFWGIGDGSLDEADIYDPEWMSWVPAGNILMLQTNDDGKLEGDFHVPVFIEDQDVTVVVGLVGADGIPHFDSKTISPGGVSYTMWLIIIIVIAIILAVAAVFIKSRFF
ncbi:MAG: hypothetical protein KAR56_01010 [Thermoplasmata archaeon]|nr:hypothetical protein [Thermoplasmata archaeon]